MSFKDPEKQRQYQRNWVAKRRAAYFKGKRCSKCGSGDEACLELDHVDPALKIDHRIWSWTEARRLIELEKCQILCYVCHLEKTRSSYPTVTHGTVTMYRQKCRCSACRRANSAAMRIHRQAGRDETGET